MTSDPSSGAGDLVAAIDRFGGDLDRWADRGLAQEVRSAALADRVVRAELDRSRRLDTMLAAAAAAMDAEIARSGAAARVSGSVMAAVGLTRSRRKRWMAVAAALVVAAGLGSLMDLSVVRRVDDGVDVVILDPLVFGPMEWGQQP